MTRSRWLLSALVAFSAFPAMTAAAEKVKAPVVLGTQGAEVYCIAFNPDGKTVASGDNDGVIILWDVSTRKQRLKIETGDRLLRALAFSPDGKTLASGGKGMAVKLWDLATGKSTLAIPQNKMVFALAISPDGKTLAAASGKFIKLHDLATGKETASLDAQTTAFQSLMFSPSGKQLMAGCGGLVRLWDLPTSNQQAAFYGSYPALGSDGKTLIAANYKEFLVKELATGKERTFPAANTVMGLALGAEGKTMVTMDYDRALRLWDTTKGERLATWHDGEHWQSCVAISPDGKTVVFGGRNKKVWLWDVSGAR